MQSIQVPKRMNFKMFEVCSNKNFKQIEKKVKWTEKKIEAIHMCLQRTKNDSEVVVVAAFVSLKEA